MADKAHQTTGSILEKLNQAGMALFMFVVVAGAIMLVTGNVHFGPAVAAQSGFDGATSGSDVHEHEEDAGDHSRGDVNGPDLAELENQTCEHAIRTVECDRCRFELGVVKLRPAVAGALVETQPVRAVRGARVLKLTGHVQFDKTRVVEVVPTGAGRVTHVDRSLGRDVSQGDVLAVIHSADFGQAKAGYIEALARLELAKSTFDREKDLHNKKVSSKADYLSALSELDAATAYYSAAEKRLRLFGLDTEQINATAEDKNGDRFAELVLRAPQAGTIIAQNVSAGAIVDTTETLYTIADLSNLWVWCDLYEKDLAALHELLASGASIDAKVRVNAFGPEVFGGRVDLIGSEMDEHTRTIKVRIQVKNEKRRLRPGMFAEARITVPLEGAATAVPSTAVMSDEGLDFVFCRWKDDLWIRRNVRLGRSLGDLVEVLDGVHEGDVVVSRGGFMLKSDILKEKMGAGCAD